MVEDPQNGLCAKSLQKKNNYISLDSRFVDLENTGFPTNLSNPPPPKTWPQRRIILSKNLAIVFEWFYNHRDSQSCPKVLREDS